MMISPKIIGIASIIPGLGFWLLGQYRRSIGAFILTIFFLITAITLSLYLRGPISNNFWYIVIMVWVGQIYFSVDTAKFLKKHSTKNRQIEISNQQGMTKNERFSNNVWLTVKQQLSTKEHLNAAIFGFYFVKRNDGIKAQFPVRPIYLAITDISLLIIETDFLSYPMTPARIDKLQIKSIVLRKGLLNDTLLLCYQTIEETNCLEIKVSFRLREQTKLLALLASTN